MKATADETPLIEVLSSADGSKEAKTRMVKIVPSDAEHPHQPHAHPPTKSTAGATPPHHHLVPRVLSETEHRLPRAHGVDVTTVEELDREWTEEPTEEQNNSKSSKDKQQAKK